MISRIGIVRSPVLGPGRAGAVRARELRPLKANVDDDADDVELPVAIKPQPRRMQISKIPEKAKAKFSRGDDDGDGDGANRRPRKGPRPGRSMGAEEPGTEGDRGQPKRRSKSRGANTGDDDRDGKTGRQSRKTFRKGGRGTGDDDGSLPGRKGGRGKGRDRDGGRGGAAAQAAAADQGKIDIRKRRGARAERKQARKERDEANAREKEEILGVGAAGISVDELAERLAVTPAEVIKALFLKGIMAQMNQQLDADAVKVVADQYGVLVVDEEDDDVSKAAKKDVAFIQEEDIDFLKARPPVVTVMGHVDHGKTSLLDFIRKSRVAAGEAGGITQSIGAYNVELDPEEEGGPKRGICFLDTPGHEAFSAMRARGAKVTDVAIVIVAADDGVQPQTREAVAHAQAAEVPIIVAINKVDKPEANPEKIKQQLASELSLVPEEWGGEVPMIPLSAKTGEGVGDLLEMVSLVAETLELVANPEALAQGTVVEGELDRRRGAVATVLVQAGTLKQGDVMVVGPHFGRVRSMMDDLGNPVKEAGPSVAVQVFGLGGVPSAGTVFKVMESETEARREAEAAQAKERDERLASQLGQSMVSLSSLATYDDDTDVIQRINVVLRADASGTVEAIKAALGQLPQDRVQLRYLLASPGELTESDIDLAVTSEALVLGFNTTPSESVQAKAKATGVEIWTYDIIYALIDDVRARMEGKLKAVEERQAVGMAKVKAVFGGGSAGRVAGVEVTEGSLRKGALVEVRRGRKEVVGSNIKINSLRRFKDLVNEVEAGTECGMGVEGFKDWQEGDVIECYEVVVKKQSLEEASEVEQVKVMERREALGVAE